MKSFKYSLFLSVASTLIYNSPLFAAGQAGVQPGMVDVHVAEKADPNAAAVQQSQVAVAAPVVVPAPVVAAPVMMDPNATAQVVVPAPVVADPNAAVVQQPQVAVAAPIVAPAPAVATPVMMDPNVAAQVVVPAPVVADPNAAAVQQPQVAVAAPAVATPVMMDPNAAAQVVVPAPAPAVAAPVAAPAVASEEATLKAAATIEELLNKKTEEANVQPIHEDHHGEVVYHEEHSVEAASIPEEVHIVAENEPIASSEDAVESVDVPSKKVKGAKKPKLSDEEIAARKAAGADKRAARAAAKEQASLEEQPLVNNEEGMEAGHVEEVAHDGSANAIVANGEVHHDDAIVANGSNIDEPAKVEAPAKEPKPTYAVVVMTKVGGKEAVSLSATESHPFNQAKKTEEPVKVVVAPVESTPAVSHEDAAAPKADIVSGNAVGNEETHGAAGGADAHLADHEGHHDAAAAPAEHHEDTQPLIVEGTPEGKKVDVSNAEKDVVEPAHHDAATSAEHHDEHAEHHDAAPAEHHDAAATANVKKKDDKHASEHHDAVVEHDDGKNKEVAAQ